MLTKYSCDAVCVGRACGDDILLLNERRIRLVVAKQMLKRTRDGGCQETNTPSARLLQFHPRSGLLPGREVQSQRASRFPSFAYQ
jgi:hypothetical protein